MSKFSYFAPDCTTEHMIVRHFDDVHIHAELLVLMPTHLIFKLFKKILKLKKRGFSNIFIF
jgi:hypothetical protein